MRCGSEMPPLSSKLDGVITSSLYWGGDGGESDVVSALVSSVAPSHSFISIMLDS